MLSVDLALGRLQLQVDENMSKKHSEGEEEEEEGAAPLPDSVAAFLVSDCQRVMVLRRQTLQKPQHCCILALDVCILQLFYLHGEGWLASLFSVQLN